VDEAEDDIDIVDHQVEDDADFGAPGIELCEAMDFDEERVQFGALQGEVGRVEAFHMSDLQFDIRLFDQFDEFPGFGHGTRERFFHEDVAAFANGFFA
jgi:hypothetical protein